MADEISLRAIGLALSAVAAAVTMMAAIAVINVDRGIDLPAPTAVLATSTG